MTAQSALSGMQTFSENGDAKEAKEEEQKGENSYQDKHGSH